MPEQEVLPPETHLAVRRTTHNGEPDPAQEIRDAARALELRWEEERKKREQWDEEDRADMFYARLVAMMAAAYIGEGAASTRPKKEQVASLSIEYADEVMKELRKRGYFMKRVAPPATPK